ncbi:MAG: hypothetical protein R2748_26450 [Bryobacterales bacterium]
MLLEISEAFNGDEALVFQARAKLADAEQGPEAALELLEQSFRADWDPALVRTYFQALESADRLRARQEEARTALRQNPRDLRATAWLFDYAQRQGDRAAAVAALDWFRRAHEGRRTGRARICAFWPDCTARLGSSRRCGQERLRPLPSLPGAESEDRETALAELIDDADGPNSSSSLDRRIFALPGHRDARREPGAIQRHTVVLFSNRGWAGATQARASLAQLLPPRGARRNCSNVLGANSRIRRAAPSSTPRSWKRFALYGSTRA